jgi:hypothetical protein
VTGSGRMGEHGSRCSGDPGDVAAAWRAYQAAAQRLDAVRRAAAAEAARHAEAAQAARQELTRVRAQLAASHARLGDLGATPADLLPGEREAATAAVSGGPLQALDALRRAGSTLDSSKAALTGRGPRRPARLTRLARRNLLAYAPMALAALAGQIALYLLAGGSGTVGILAAGLLLPVAAFGFGWLTIGLAFPAGPTGRVERTPLLGAVVCAAPALLAFAVTAVLVGRQ